MIPTAIRPAPAGYALSASGSGAPVGFVAARERRQHDAAARALRVLIVEDDPLIALDLRMHLQDDGHEVAGWATTHREALETAEAVGADVALMDLRLADGSFGGDAARALHDECGIPSIIVSGNLDRATRERLGDLRPLAMVWKPWRWTTIAEALSDVTPRH